MRLCLSCAAIFETPEWDCPRCGFSPPVFEGVPAFAPEIARGNPLDADYALDQVSEAEHQHFWFTSRSRLIAWAIRRYFPSARSLFDVGCGTGGVLVDVRQALPGARLAAGDALLSALAYARRQLPDVSFVQIDITRLPFEREFELIGAFDVLEHLDDDTQALRELYRATTIGGGLIVTVPQHQFLWSAIDVHSRHRRRYSRRELVSTIARAGYTIERVTSFMTVTLPLQLASRARNALTATHVSEDEMRIGPPLNAGLRMLCAVERRVIRSGMSLPVGGSLLLVARRTR